MKIYRAVYRPVLTFGCESWVMTQRQRSKVRAAEMRYLRGVYGVNIMDKINSQKICDELQVQRVEDFIKQRQLGWWGHLQRMRKEIWETTMVGKKKMGRLRRTWEDDIAETLKERGISRREARQLARDRVKWKEFIGNC